MQNSNPDTLTVSVAEDITLRDVPPGGKHAVTKKTLEESTKEDVPPEVREAQQKAMNEYIRLSDRYAEPNNIQSKWVTGKDLPIVLADGKDMVAMCNLPRGKFSGGAALAHNQIEKKNPLRFFALPNGMLVINPVIINHTRYPVYKEEGCLSFPDKAIKNMVPRFNKVTVMYQSLRQDDSGEPYLSEINTEEFNGNTSHVFQHECSHLNGHNVYDEDYRADFCAWFGDGIVRTLPDLERMYETKKVEKVINDKK